MRTPGSAAAAAPLAPRPCPDASVHMATRLGAAHHGAWTEPGPGALMWSPEASGHVMRMKASGHFSGLQACSAAFSAAPAAPVCPPQFCCGLRGCAPRPAVSNMLDSRSPGRQLVQSLSQLLAWRSPLAFLGLHACCAPRQLPRCPGNSPGPAAWAGGRLCRCAVCPWKCAPAASRSPQLNRALNPAWYSCVWLLPTHPPVPSRRAVQAGWVEVR